MAISEADLEEGVMGDENERLGPPWVLFTDDGAPAYIMPAGRPGDVANVSGLSVDDAERVVRLANKASDVRKLGAERDMWRGEYESLCSELVRSLREDLATLRAQRDEARALVRRYVEGDCLYDELNEEQACNAVLRWDEEEKKR